tara:strand:- start:3335 stop:3643 length:309 start_codon:yes stop_codon:yes gene_type:complete
MSVTNKIRVVWEFDIETNTQLQELLEITSSEVEVMLEDEDDKEKLHRLCCSATGTPRFVDLDLFFEDPHAVSNDQITDALSDEYGWLIQEWEYVQQRINKED